MRAADALGLLAGLGALNAVRGGREGTGKRFTGLIDMLDGGGAGASGDRFEGGGLLSMLGNLFAKPIEAQDNVERIAADASATRALTDAIKPESSFPNYAPPSVSSMVGSGRGDFGMPMQDSGNRMMDINAVPTSGPNPLVAAEIARMREAQRMMDINAIPAAPVESSSVQPSGILADQLTRNAMNFAGATPVGDGTIVSPRREDYSQAENQLTRNAMNFAGVTPNAMNFAGVTPVGEGTIVDQTVLPQLSYKSDPVFMSVAQNDATFLSMPEAARQNIYNMYLQRGNMQ
jgi:CBS domain-containing protein